MTLGGGRNVFRFRDINNLLVHKCVEFIMWWKEDSFHVLHFGGVTETKCEKLKGVNIM